MVAVMMSKNSWVAKWNNLAGLRPGVYGIDVKPGVSLVQSHHEDRDYLSDEDGYYNAPLSRNEREVQVKRENLY